MTEQEGKVVKNKKSLLTKYQIPLDHLSFAYIKKCNDRKELRKIVKILRSGEEGYYPQLTECAESHLKQIDPQCCLLRKEDPVLTKSTLGTEKWNNITNEMANWAEEMKSRDEVLHDSSAAGPDLPAVRKTMSSKLSCSQAEKHKAGPSRTKSAAPRDYSEWDKFDVDKEILKMELEDERKREQITKNKKLQEKEKKKIKNEEDNSITKASSNLSSVEKEYMATKEKDRGNEYYHSGEFEQAVKCYSNSIVLCPTPAAYNNRAMAQLKLQKYEAVVADCNQVLEAEPLNVKALHRRGVAYQGKNCYEQAYEDFSKIMELEPENQAAKLLADQVKNKLEPAVKTVRLSIEDECYQPHGFVFPSPKPNIAVNEWGLAKVMCRCNGTPAWAYKKPPKCKVCQRKRAERRAKREEEARKAAEISELNDAQSIEIDQMQTDEKGSGDMRAKEKIVKLETGDDCNIQVQQDDTYIKVEEQNRNLDARINEKIISTEDNIMRNDNKDNSYRNNIVNKENNVIEEQWEISTNTSNEINSIATSNEGNMSKSNIEIECDKKILATEDMKMSPKIVKTNSLPVTDNCNEKPMKIKIANKYKRNLNHEQETTSEQQECEDVSSVSTITSPFEFVKVWESLKVTSDLSSHANVLRSIKPSDLVSVIGNKLDGPMLSTILMCLEKNFTPELTMEYLNTIVHLPRFNIVKMFLKEPEKQAVRKLLEKLDNSKIPATSDLWTAFSC